MVILDILEEHLEEADFLWEQRENLIWDRTAALAGLADHEERLLAHLDGLVLGGSDAWAMLEPKLSADAPGEVFAAAFVALESGNPERLDLLREMLPSAKDAVPEGIRHALRHAPTADVERIVLPLLNGGPGPARAAAIEVLSFRRSPIATDVLEAALREQDPLIAATAARAAGRLRNLELRRGLEAAWESASAAVRLEALRAGILHGNERAVPQCRKAIRERREEAAEATTLIGLAGHPEDAALLAGLLGEDRFARNAITALGLLGRAAGMPPLIRCTANPKLARLAGEAISDITGIDFERENLTVPKAEPPAVSAPTGEDDELPPDPDEDLPYPDAAKLEGWWRDQASHFDERSRYRYGRPHSPQELINILHTGALRRRHHAALELAMANPACLLVETHALVTQQRRQMSSLK